jgi:hypothetical protein
MIYLVVLATCTHNVTSGRSHSPSYWNYSNTIVALAPRNLSLCVESKLQLPKRAKAAPGVSKKKLAYYVSAQFDAPGYRVFPTVKGTYRYLIMC